MSINIIKNYDEDISNLNTKTTITQHKVTLAEAIAENTDYTIPCNYKVGTDVLEVYYMGEKLVKGVHYIEVGNNNSISNKIQFYNWGQSVPVGVILEFIVRGVYS